MEDTSEYTDADESISAPTEILAEFLFSMMTKDYKKALKYCEIILSYEPANSTVKEFYPLIIEKIKIIEKEEGEESDSSDSSDSASSYSSDEMNSNKKNSDSNRTTASYSSLEDDSYFDEWQDSNLLEMDIRNGNAQADSLTSEMSQSIKRTHEESETKTFVNSKDNDSKFTNQILNSSKPICSLKRNQKLSMENEKKTSKTNKKPTSNNFKTMSLNISKENINSNFSVPSKKIANSKSFKVDRK